MGVAVRVHSLRKTDGEVVSAVRDWKSVTAVVWKFSWTRV